MAAISGFELFAVDLPFRKPFKHAAAERISSDSLFLKCRTDTGVSGFGESLTNTKRRVKCFTLMFLNIPHIRFKYPLIQFTVRS